VSLVQNFSVQKAYTVFALAQPALSKAREAEWLPDSRRIVAECGRPGFAVCQAGPKPLWHFAKLEAGHLDSQKTDNLITLGLRS
jgi:hypothetical protein